MKKIIVTKHIGFCSGVRRCITLVENELKNGIKVYTLGDLLHNEQEMARLKNLGVEVITDLAQLKIEDSKSCLAIRTHGAEKKVYEQAKMLPNLKIVDGTCPIVKKNQQIVEEWSKKGFNIIIFGDVAHPEIKALLSYINPAVKYHIVESVNLVNNVNFDQDYQTVVVAQTTKPVDEYYKLIEILQDKYKKIKIFHTICKETILREKEISELAKKVELVVVIGGKHSANTNKLVSIAKKYNNNVMIINSENEINVGLDQFNTIGICSGASTPEWLVKIIINKLQSL